MRKIILHLFLSLLLFAISFHGKSESESATLSDIEKELFDSGLNFKTLGRWDDAINEFNKVLNANPKSSESYYQIGIIYDYQLRYDEAIGFFQKASETDSKYAFFAGLDYENLGKWDNAISSFKKVLSSYPDFIKARFHLGLSYKKNGMINDAISEFKNILIYEPNHGGSVYNLSIIYKDLGLPIEAKKEALRFNQITFSEWEP
ncbi:MAG: hypothetical protein A3C43_07140 [Candidatus Schekmanbacteria bacterium RIFCSPHIGHO2_02_FULL_38_11]|uniref:Uncharacterized protein n=1 Tax=Candidatus Schekmanbacteria bacterium RIFCSPLOWO2_12_FULL_38_15 TaxID=1817883 RepID=A0A1F7SKA5_9BACT|nr:MAG: hypothetical protein A2043_02030 [Candidatus Schekmanbacteria bacterium GWA2_38_9]OGL51265.1 MAG: hypothetical protein A3H37_10660 [Candidatus Schekmanbacteria bacterium RIFCSPLOWO2_02_FULL_38_14]OGL53660.1 MAG: hypothetical protein A3C43_07140 [Candidatus Schekmanbacteria bacterium RIFCSPHIGHO2_02_FULL_38_11]OGL54216.1 MAG: hypothetical protein A3G31_05500 [Candidatus Schekmanbacteria bacterium RIFCSPLOWO2_12_FULL_38_15]